MFLLKRVEDGLYVAKHGNEKSYTRDIDKVRLYPTIEEARRDQCGNEVIVPLEKLKDQEANR